MTDINHFVCHTKVFFIDEMGSYLNNPIKPSINEDLEHIICVISFIIKTKQNYFKINRKCALIQKYTYNV